jgi:hypothetical protein
LFVVVDAKKVPTSTHDGKKNNVYCLTTQFFKCFETLSFHSSQQMSKVLQVEGSLLFEEDDSSDSDEENESNNGNGAPLVYASDESDEEELEVFHPEAAAAAKKKKKPDPSQPGNVVHVSASSDRDVRVLFSNARCLFFLSHTHTMFFCLQAPPPPVSTEGAPPSSPPSTEDEDVSLAIPRSSIVCVCVHAAISRSMH